MVTPTEKQLKRIADYLERMAIGYEATVHQNKDNIAYNLQHLKIADQNLKLNAKWIQAQITATQEKKVEKVEKSSLLRTFTNF